MKTNTDPKPESERDGGFTLVELLMAITIMGIILVTLGFSVTEGFRNATQSKASIDRSILSTFAARYFAPDIASTTFGATSIVTTNPPACGVDATSVIDIQTSANTAVSYGYETAGGSRSLVRSTCSGNVTGSLTLIAQKHLGTTDASLTPTATCATTTSCSLTLTWHNPDYSITVSGARWVNATTTTAP
jgi:prepilin-type N-terminal cleavage/methylation domain-containing protein